MRGVYTNLTEIRRRVFCEVARFAYTADFEDYEWVDDLPYKILPGETSTDRESIFLERAIIGERIRLAMGLPLQSVDARQSLSAGVVEAAQPETYYQPPLINIISFACHGCPEDSYVVTDQCQGCLAHPCREICPKDAISFVNHRAFIDQEKCIKCGRCKDVCPYTAINHRERPCAASCGMDAISSDEHGHAQIDYDRCVSCGQCLINCPFGAIADKSQLFQVILALRSKQEVIACVAPAFVGQFGAKADAARLRAAFLELGFSGVEEVALGADLCSVEEAQDFVHEVGSELPFMATSCCPAWAMMAKMEFPEHEDCVSMALTPMTLTARLLRTRHPNAKIVFVGPCSAKKLEAMRTSVRSEVDFVLTFEELAGMMEAKGIVPDNLPEATDTRDFGEASADGRGFAVSGGVARAVVNVVKELDPNREVVTRSAEGLNACRAMMKDAVRGKCDGMLLEGMACPGGCVAGPGTMQQIKRSQTLVGTYRNKSPFTTASQNAYVKDLPNLMHMHHDAHHEHHTHHPDPMPTAGAAGKEAGAPAGE
jgi:[FeFe] hydrogenase (group B1/B3)